MGTEYPLISIVVPVYKVESYLRKCVDSLLSQTYPNLEIILVDDGSPDTCPQLCDQLADENEKVVVYHKVNGGLGSARNYGVEKARADWIVFVDSDDYVLPEYVSYMWELREKYDADLVTCGITQVDEAGNPLYSYTPFESWVCTGAKAIRSVYFEKKGGHRSCSKIVKKCQILNHPFPSGYFEDFATTYLYFHECEKVVFGDGAANYRYVQRDGSILNSRLSSKHFLAFDICEEIATFIKKNYPEYIKYIPLLYQGQVVQILNKQSMEKEQFAEIFNRYKKMFRGSCVRMMFLSNIKWKVKVYFMLLCTTPRVYNGFRKLM